MLVYNLTEAELNYKGKKIPPNGGSVNMPDLTFIPDRDRALESSKVLAFGKLPKWWTIEQALKAAAAAPAPKVAAVVAQPGVPNRNGEVFDSKKIVITTSESPVEVTDKVSVSMSSKKK